MPTLLMLVIVAGIVYFYYESESKKVMYRIKLLDRLNGSVRYITDVDGIKEAYFYNSNPGVANIYTSFEHAKHIVDTFAGENQADWVIEKRQFSLLGSTWLEIRSDS